MGVFEASHFSTKGVIRRDRHLRFPTLPATHFFRSADRGFAERRASQLHAPCRAKWPDNSLSELEAMLWSLTYGEMMEFAEGIMQQVTEKPTDANSLAALIHRWAVRNRQQLVTLDR